MVPSTCRSFDTAREICNECYAGYGRDQFGICVEQDQGDLDPYCAEFVEDRCVKCSQGAFFNDDN